MDIKQTNSFNSISAVTTASTGTQTKISNIDKTQYIDSVKTTLNSSAELEVVTYTREGKLSNDSSIKKSPDDKKIDETIPEKTTRMKDEEEKKERIKNLIFPPFSFNYDNETHDFYFKVERGEFVKEVVQYPADSMLEWKIYRKQLLDTYV